MTTERFEELTETQRIDTLTDAERIDDMIDDVSDEFDVDGFEDLSQQEPYDRA